MTAIYIMEKLYNYQIYTEVYWLGKAAMLDAMTGQTLIRMEVDMFRGHSLVIMQQVAGKKHNVFFILLFLYS